MRYDVNGGEAMAYVKINGKVVDPEQVEAVQFSQVDETCATAELYISLDGLLHEMQQADVDVSKESMQRVLEIEFAQFQARALKGYIEFCFDPLLLSPWKKSANVIRRWSWVNVKEIKVTNGDVIVIGYAKPI